MSFFIADIPWALCLHRQDGRIAEDDLHAIAKCAGSGMYPMFTDRDLASRFIGGSIGRSIAELTGRELVAFRPQTAASLDSLLEMLEGMGVTDVAFDANDAGLGVRIPVAEIRKNASLW